MWTGGAPLVAKHPIVASIISSRLMYCINYNFMGALSALFARFFHDCINTLQCDILLFEMAPQNSMRILSDRQTCNGSFVSGWSERCNCMPEMGNLITYFAVIRGIKIKQGKKSFF